MIPDFDENGNLPPGVHWAEWNEFQDRFGYNWHRNFFNSILEQIKRLIKVALHINHPGINIPKYPDRNIYTCFFDWIKLSRLILCN